jgi:hypothetical protein
MKFKIKRPPFEKGEPMVLTRPCDCGDPDCDKIMFAILRPQIKHLTDTGETAYVAYMPAETAKGMIEWLEDELGSQKGKTIQ